MDTLFDLLLHTDDALLVMASENIGKTYFILFIIIMLETGIILFPFLPGDGLLFSAGVVAATTDMNIWMLAFLLIMAAILGNLINYFSGVFLGNRALNSKNRIISRMLKNYLPKAEIFYAKHGGRAIVLGRFFPIIRTYIPFVAGLVRMQRIPFVKNTIVGAIAWIVFFLFLGHSLGEVPWIKDNYGLIYFLLVLFSSIPPIVIFMGNQFSRK